MTDTTDNNLYKLTEQFNYLDEMLLKSEGEITDEYNELFAKIMPLLLTKVDGCCGFVQKQSDLIVAAQNRIADLNKFIKTRENTLERFNDYIAVCLEKSGQEIISGEFHEIKMSKARKVVKILKENEISSDYVESKMTVTIDKKAIKNDLEKGLKVQGACLIDGDTKVQYKLIPASRRDKK